MKKNYKELLKDITTFIFDVDGVFTDGSILVTTKGEMLRKMNVKDGYALKTALLKGYNVCVITGGTNEGVRDRLKGLGVTDIYLGAHHKQDSLDEYLDIHGIDPKNTLYMGDDLPDLEPMRRVGLPVCPKDAAHEIRNIALYVSPIEGGRGCARDVIEKVLRLKNKWLDEPRLTARKDA